MLTKQSYIPETENTLQTNNLFLYFMDLDQCSDFVKFFKITSFYHESASNTY